MNRTHALAAAQRAQQPVITITTINGDEVSAPVTQWLIALLTSLRPEDLTEILRKVESEQSRERGHVILPTDILTPPAPADPAQFTLPNGMPRRH